MDSQFLCAFCFFVAVRNDESRNDLKTFDRRKQQARAGLDVAEDAVLVDQIVRIVQVPELLE